MRDFCRTIFAGLTCFLLVLTSQSMAASRGAAAVSDQLVICGADGVITIYLDAGGNPASAPHLCPDCIIALIDIDDTQATAALVSLTSHRVARPVQDNILPRYRENQAQARAPPRAS